MVIYNILVKLLDGKTITLRFPNPKIQVDTLKSHIYNITRIPPHHQRLITRTQEISSQTLITHPNESTFLSVNLLLRLLGGKGGFGSQLRNTATKRKTTNFDACRDIHGRRLRYVNAEKKLQEWDEDSKGRELEKIAEDFLKKQAKAAKKSREGEAEKYVEEYREVSNKCVGIIEASVRDSIAMGGLGSKRFKVSQTDEVVDAEKIATTLDVEPEVVGCYNNVGEGKSASISTLTIDKPLDVEPEVESCYNVGEANASVSIVTVSAKDSDYDNPLDFGDYESAKEMEVVGMEILKVELRARGLKCGGTLEERAARLFLLKTTPIDMLPKKVFAKI